MNISSFLFVDDFLISFFKVILKGGYFFYELVKFICDVFKDKDFDGVYMLDIYNVMWIFILYDFIIFV